MNYIVMPIEVSISNDDEFLVTSVKGNNYFQEMLSVMRQFHGKFDKHNIETRDGRLFKNPWVFDLHLAQPVCKALKEKIPEFIIPNWVENIDFSVDSEFKRFRGNIIPELVKSEYKGKTDYQKNGILKGITQNRLAWIYDLGLGKSFVMQTTLNHLIHWGRVNKYVIVCPPEGVINIALECIKFSSFGLTMDDIYIVDTNNRNPFEYPDKKVFIMTYRNLIMLHDDAYKEAQKKRSGKIIRKNYIPWEKLGDKLCLILDESQKCKNAQSKTWKIVDKSKHFFEYRYLLTGTPVEKYTKDLWTQIRFLQEDAVPRDYYDFLRSIAFLGTRWSQWEISSYREDDVKAFLNRVSYLIDRQKTEGNIDLPPVIYDPIRCQMSPKQEMLYRAIVDQVLTQIRKTENGRITMRQLSNKYPYLLQVLHDPLNLLEGSFSEGLMNDSILQQLKNWQIEDNGKYAVAASLVEKYAEEGRKIILWSSHPKIIDTLAEKFKKYEPCTLHGGTVIDKGESVAERNAKVCASFLKNKKSFLLIVNPSCLATAVNLVEVTRMIGWDRSWEAITYKQLIKRANRIGSTEPLVVHNLITYSSIEEYQNEEIEKRLAFNDDLWDSGKVSRDVLESRDVLTLADVKKIITGKE